jgi:hypothetical protein
MIKWKIVHFRQEWLAKLPPAPAEGEPVTCPACLGQHPLIYEDEKPTASSWGYVECDWEYVKNSLHSCCFGLTTPTEILLPSWRRSLKYAARRAKAPTVWVGFHGLVPSGLSIADRSPSCWLLQIARAWIRVVFFQEKVVICRSRTLMIAVGTSLGPYEKKR